jgi:hypothetical protein
MSPPVAARRGGGVWRSRPVRTLRRLLSAPPRGLSALRGNPPPQQRSLAGLVALSLLGVVGTLTLGTGLCPPGAQTLPLLLGGLLLGRRALVRLAGLSWIYLGGQVPDAPVGSVAVVAVVGLFAWESARSRDETGLGGLRGDTVLVELRRRLQQQGRLPALPRGWRAEVVVRPAGDGPFSGDFIVSALSPAGVLEVALVDVSGKGVDAGTRALLLSGALGGLLGGAAGDFLPAANAYLVRQDWEEGFATAVHVVVDLRTGDYAIDSAGHPPVAHFDAGSGLWSLADADGLVLGLLPDVSYRSARGRLDPGDALLLYTDGLVEIPGRDLSVGIDKLLGEAERLVPQGFAGGAEVLVSRCAGTSPDDRGLVLLWRDR